MKRFFSFDITFIILFLVFLPFSLQGEQKNILFLHTWPTSFPWSKSMNEGIEEALASRRDWGFYSESIDSPILGGRMEDRDWFAYFSKKYAGMKFDAVLSEGDKAGYFLSAFGESLFGDAYKVMFTEDTMAEYKSRSFNVISQQSRAVIDTGRMAIDQNPESRRFIIIDSEDDDYRNVREKLQRIAIDRDLAVVTYSDFSFESLLQSIRELSGNEIVFFFPVSKDNRGETVVPRQLLADLAAVSPSPIYSSWSTFLGTGCVGGKMVDGRRIALEMFKIAESFLQSGEYDEEYLTTRVFIDWQAARRYDLDWHSVQGDVTVVNRPEAFFSRHSRIIMLSLLAVLFPLFVLALISLILSVRAHRDLERAKDHLERAQKVASLGVWEHDLETESLTWSDEVYKIIELDRTKTFPSIETFLQIVHPEDRANLVDRYGRSLETHETLSDIHRLVMEDGRIKWVEQQFSTQFDKNGEAAKTVGTIYDISKQKEGELIFKSLLDNASDGIHILDGEGNILFCSRSFAKNLGYEYEEVKSLNIADWEAFLSQEQIHSTLQLLLQSDITFESKHKRKDGSCFDVQISATDISVGGRKYIYATQRDITLQKHYVEQLNKLNAMLNTASRIGQIGFWEFDNSSHIIDWNDALFEIYEVEERDRPIGNDWFFSYIPEDERANIRKEFFKSIEEKKDYSLVHRIRTEKGNIKTVDERGKHFFDGEGRLVKTIGSVLDITERIEREELIKKQAVTDELTQLGNRKAYNERIDELIAQYKRYGLGFSLLIFDIDLFKDINDTFGHLTGDKVLAELGGIVAAMVRRNDYVFRIGGEEFVILMSGTELEKCALFAEKVRKAIQQGITVIGNRKITVSIGVGEMEQNDTADSLLRKADRNLYQAKRKGRNRVVADRYPRPVMTSSQKES